MGAYNIDQLPEAAIGLRLYKHVGERLIGCKPVYFTKGRPAVDTVLRRAALSGRVEFEGPERDYFADILIDESGSWDASISLDRKSYAALKNHWMRCEVDRHD